MIQQLIELGTIEYSSAKSSFYQAFKLMHILSKQFRRLLVERIVGIGFVKQINQSVNDRVNVQDGLPIFPQNIQADFALQVNVGMVNAGFAFHFGWCVGIVWGNDKSKVVGGAFPVTGIGCDGNVKGAQVVGARKGNLCYFSTI